jgi:hypothetical protein
VSELETWTNVRYLAGYGWMKVTEDIAPSLPTSKTWEQTQDEDKNITQNETKSQSRIKTGSH